MILQNTADLNYIPKRIISLVPSQTELLFDLGLEAETVGITKFCIHPQAWFFAKQRIGGTKTIHFDKISALNPDLIIANKEENTKEQVEELALHYPVWLTDVKNLGDSLQMIADIGDLTAKAETATLLIDNIKKAFETLPKSEKPVNTAYLIWQKPYMIIGGDTFISDMLLQCGFENVFASKMRYPEISIAELQTGNCKLLLLSSEPYPFKQSHIDELQQYLPNTKIVLVDGEMFSWYGSRLLQSPQYFKQLLLQIEV